jgi:hypothetical protein
MDSKLYIERANSEIKLAETLMDFSARLSVTKFVSLIS